MAARARAPKRCRSCQIGRESTARCAAQGGGAIASRHNPGEVDACHRRVRRQFSRAPQFRHQALSACPDRAGTCHTTGGAVSKPDSAGAHACTHALRHPIPVVCLNDVCWRHVTFGQAGSIQDFAPQPFPYRRRVRCSRTVPAYVVASAARYAPARRGARARLVEAGDCVAQCPRSAGPRAASANYQVVRHGIGGNADSGAAWVRAIHRTAMPAKTTRITDATGSAAVSASGGYRTVRRRRRHDREKLGGCPLRLQGSAP